MPDYEKLFRESAKAYDDKDYDRMMSFVTDDYSFFSLTDEGMVQRSRGKEQAVAGLKMVLESDDYERGEVAFLKQFGNLVVAYEKDRYRVGDEFVTRGTVGVYQYRGDKLDRVFSFPVDDAA